jgi:aspartate/methionine/tyrosine aminotransferase
MVQTLNAAIETLIPYTSKTIAREVEADPDFLNLSIGEPDYGPPSFAWPAIGAALTEPAVTAALKKYEKSRGAIELRTAIAQYYQRHYELRYDPESEIMVTHGGAGALTVSILATTREGDDILIPDPSYMLYEGLVRILGRRPVRVERDAAEGWRYNLDAFKARISDRTKVLIFNSPENPTGYVCTEEELRALVSFTADHGLWLIHDEVYDQTVYGVKHQPASACVPDAGHVILVNSFSKKFAVPGLRIGWLAGAQRALSAAGKVHDYAFLAVNKTSEMIGQLLISHPEADSWFAKMRTELVSRMDAGQSLLQRVPGVRFVRRPQGGLFLFPNVSEMATYLSDARSVNSKSAGDFVSAFLRDRLKIAAVPGSVYGPGCKDHIRIVFCVDPKLIVRACERMQNGIGELATPKVYARALMS